MSAPRVALIGMGRMGREIRRLALELDWTVVTEIHSAENTEGAAITHQRLAGADVAIEFTAPSAAVANVRACIRAGCPVVVGTTGWQHRLVDVAGDVNRAGGAMLWAANFSMGVNILWQLAERAAAVAGRTGTFQAHIIETHHAAKKDSPSGTAIELQRIVSSAFGSDVPVTSIRVGSVPGTHELLLDARYEQLLLTHEARDRRVFAEGALAAARWLVGRRGVFTMRDVLRDDIEREG